MVVLTFKRPHSWVGIPWVTDAKIETILYENITKSKMYMFAQMDFTEGKEVKSSWMKEEI